MRFQPSYALAYEVGKSTIPMRNYHADVRLSKSPQGGTTISWRSSFQAHWPLAPLIDRRLRSFIADTAERLATAALSGTS